MEYNNEIYHITANIKYRIIYSKIKNIYIQIKDGEVTVKAPKYTSINYIEKIVNSKKAWILKKIQDENTVTKNIYSDGGIIKVLGKTYILKIIYSLDSKNSLYTEDRYICCKLNKYSSKCDEQANIKKLIDKYYKYIATQEIPAVMDDLKNRTGLAPLECNIKNLKATWGICSSKKKISINQKLMAYSRHAIEYVCLHEICHLKYMNHSKDFWNMVEYYMPDYKLAKKELKG